MPIDPMKTTGDIVDNYIGYLKTTFAFSDPNINHQLNDLLNEKNKFYKGPFLEATPAFSTSKSIKDLIIEGVLSKEFLKLNSPDLDIERPLYLHQEKAIRKIVVLNRNIIVATGTGSGKTESFLIPILNHLFEEKERGTLNPGVRALLLYPMNALANDQLKRMRAVLRNYKSITFGAYTGETLENQQAAVERFRKVYQGKEPLDNEIISRENMRKNPPHILITNYAMLEYLLLRPADNVFFDGEYSKYWNFIVLDEAHTYSGAKGIEVSMLIRRLKNRIKAKNLRCIATSATLGDQNNLRNVENIVSFGKNIFGENFEWVTSDDKKQDVVFGSKKPISQEIDESASWKVAYPEIFNEISIKIAENPEKVEEIIKILSKAGLPDHLREKFIKDISNPKKFLYEIFKRESTVMEIQKVLEDGPISLTELAKRFFENKNDGTKIITAIITICSKLKPDNSSQSLIPSRYHLFIKAIEGGYIRMGPTLKIYLERNKYSIVDGEEFKVFEMAVCQQCGALYLVGKIENDLLIQIPNDEQESYENASFFLLPGRSTFRADDEDEEKVEKEIQEAKKNVYILCVKCGHIARKSLIGNLCSCDKKYKVEVVKAETKEGKVHKCISCGASNNRVSVVKRLVVGNEAPTSVLATFLYQNIPENKLEEDFQIDDGWNTTKKKPSKVKTSRRLLIFSDSRQNAAFFNSYLQYSYNQIIYRRIISEVLKQHQDEIIDDEWRIKDLHKAIADFVQKENFFDGSKSKAEIKQECWRWVLREFLGSESRNSLKNLGILGFSMIIPENWRPPTEYLNNNYNLNVNDQQIELLYKILLDNFRKKMAISLPSMVNLDDIFLLKKTKYFALKNKNNYIYSWLPSTYNSLLDFLLKLFNREDNDDIELAKRLLEEIWTKDLTRQNGAWENYFAEEPDKREGIIRQLKLDYWQVIINAPGFKWYQCDTCGKISIHNLKNICPTYKCRGTLKEIDPDKFSNNHYRKLFTCIEPIKMVVSEHTAQLTTEEATAKQQDFYDGKINVLSCSTTFELGVDVGQLESVFLRNVPPLPSNYVQRAGRAGRRTESTAFVLTYAQRKSHDYSHFKNPKRIISGEITPPKFELRNEKIIRRHIYAHALSEFWKEYPEYYGQVQSLFFEAGEGISKFEEYLNKRPEKLKHSLKKIVPEDLHEHLGIDNWDWVDEFLNSEKGVLMKAFYEVTSDVKALEKYKNEILEKEKRYKEASRIHNTIKFIKEKELIGFLAQNNVIPKYGFPVDVVELQTHYYGEEGKKIELTRDLKIALSEYAPGSQVIANGNIWTSRYIKKIPGKEFPVMRYKICKNCGHFSSEIEQRGEKTTNECPVCGERINRTGKYITPEYGFISDPPKEASFMKPKKIYSTRVYFSNPPEAEERNHLSQDVGDIEFDLSSFSGKLAVINDAGRKMFYVCSACGYTNIEKPKTHKNHLGQKCKGSFRKYAFGYEFATDILEMKLTNIPPTPEDFDRVSFWYSFLYAILEGISQHLEIDRNDIDGVLYPYPEYSENPSLIIYDDVPGGAGHVKRVKEENCFEGILWKAYEIVNECDCGRESEGHASCYACLRNYKNQHFHEFLDRRLVIDFLEKYVIVH